MVLFFLLVSLENELHLRKHLPYDLTLFHSFFSFFKCIEAAKEDEDADDDDMDGSQTDDEDEDEDEMGVEAEDGDEVDSLRLQKLAAQVS